jgi:hypothetical protein
MSTNFDIANALADHLNDNTDRSGDWFYDALYSVQGARSMFDEDRTDELDKGGSSTLYVIGAYCVEYCAARQSWSVREDDRQDVAERAINLARKMPLSRFLGECRTTAELYGYTLYTVDIGKARQAFAELGIAGDDLEYAFDVIERRVEDLNERAQGLR